MNVAIVLQGFVSLLWVLVVGLIVLSIVRASRGNRVRGLSTAILALAIVAVLLTTVSAGLVFIQPEQRGVVISAVEPNGYRTDSLQPGLRWIIPFLETVEIYPIYRQTYTMSVVHQEGDVAGDDSILARTSDGQEVRVDASVIYAIDPDKAVQLHIEWQNRYPNDLVRPLSRGVIRDAIAQFGVEEVYSSKRTEMTSQIAEVMNAKMSDNGLLLIDFVLRNITFSPEYAVSVEKKQIAEQEAQQAFYVVEQRKQEAEQARQVAQGLADSVVIAAEGQAEARLIEAEAEAKALQAIAAALADDESLLQYLYILKINPNVNVMLLPDNVPYLLPLPTMGPPAPDVNAPAPAPTSTPYVPPTPTSTPEP